MHFINTENEILNNFIKNKLSKNAPLDSKGLCKKYPYKPFLLLAIIATCNEHNKKIFNSKFCLNSDFGENICKKYYDYLSGDQSLFEILSSNKTKTNWVLGWTKMLHNEVIKNICQMPAKNLQSDFFEFNDKEKSIKLNLDVEIEDQLNLRNKLLANIILIIKICLPYYKKYSDNEIYTGISNLIHSINFIEETDEKIKRSYLFRKLVIDRDRKCVICCCDNNYVLEACHIKTFEKCNQNEAINEQNGITLCANHHKLFDNGMFSFNLNGTISISSLLNEIDEDLLIKKFESCYLTVLKLKSLDNYFVDWNKKYVFKQ